MYLQKNTLKKKLFVKKKKFQGSKIIKKMKLKNFPAPHIRKMLSIHQKHRVNHRSGNGRKNKIHKKTTKEENS